MKFERMSNQELKHIIDTIDISDPYGNLLYILAHDELEERSR